MAKQPRRNILRWLRLTVKAIRWPETMDCEMCAGKGYTTFRRKEECTSCSGTGVQK